MQRNERLGREAAEWGLVFAALLAFGFFINRNIEIKGLYMDDLYLWSCYGEQSFREYVFPVGGTRFRFVFYLISYVILGLIGTHVTWIVPVNIILNAMVAFTIYLFGRRLCLGAGRRMKVSGNGGAAGTFDVRGGAAGRLVPFFTAVCYLLSRMAYYQIGQLYGLMETFALWGALGVLYGLYIYLNENKTWGMWLSLAVYFLTCFVHERYMVLMAVILAALALRRERRWRLWMGAPVSLLAVFAIRLLFIGTLSPAGTAGTDVADTFHLGEALKFAVSQVLYVFGFNAGPEHLNGLSFGDSPAGVKVLVLASAALLAVMLLRFFILLVRDQAGRIMRLKNTVLFFLFIAMCIGCSSVTIRVEMRWVYVSYAAALLFVCYMAGQGDDGNGKEKREGAARRAWSWGWVALAAAYLAFMVPTETFYRSQYPNIYLWPNQLRYNSLAEETYETYGDSIFGKTICIVGDSYEISDFTANTFFKVYDKERKAEGLSVRFADTIRDFGQVTDDMLVLSEVPEHNAFKDVTEFVRNMKCEVHTGYYGDGWMDQRASLRLMAGSTGEIRLECYYPGALTGGEVMKVTSLSEDGGEKDVWEFHLKPLTSASQTFLIQAEPYQWIPLEFEMNFWAKDATEQRGEEKMALIVHIEAD